jgi:hypothetical protein
MWVDDVDSWMQSAASALRLGCHLVLLEGHPVSLLVKFVDPPALEGPYQGGGVVEREAGDHADPEIRTEHNVFVHYRWGIGDVVNAAIRAGLSIQSLTEWMDQEGTQVRTGKLVEDEDDRADMPRRYYAAADLPFARRSPDAGQ